MVKKAKNRRKVKKKDDLPNSVIFLLLVLTIIIVVWSTIAFLTATNSLEVNANKGFNSNTNSEGKVSFILQKPPVSDATVGFVLENSSN